MDHFLTTELSCRGRKELLCGNYNGADFIGGVMRIFDEQKQRV
jgi:hypothetical protein